jgi:hypothetical protein
VLSYYYGMTVIQLEEIFGSNEVPWRHARSEMRSTTRGNNIIPKTEIMNHYRTLKHVIHSA